MWVRACSCHSARLCAIAFAGMLVISVSPLSALPPGGKTAADQPADDSGGAVTECDLSVPGSPYIPVDSWIYPAVLRLYSLGFLDHVFLGMRPWTRASLSHMLEDTGAKIEDARAGPVTERGAGNYTLR